MSEFNELYDEHFFVIDSNNLDSIKSKFYGFSIFDNNIIREDNFKDESNLSGLGSYLYVKSDKNNISIYQDYNGSWGLYLYKERDYFAISNSFFKLVEYLKNDHKLSLNEDYANLLMVNGNSNVVFRQTLANEIDTIPRNVVVNIDKSLKYIRFNKSDYKMHYVPINTKKALGIIDDWFYRWVNIFRKLKEETNNIEFNLDGNFNTRIILILMILANIDLNKINISSKDVFSEDISLENQEIAKKIANKYNFNLDLNNLAVEKTFFNDINTSVELPFYIKGGFSNKLDYKFYKYDEIVYNFSAIGSEMMGTDSSYYGKSFNQIYANYINKSHDFDFSYVSSIDYLIRESLIEVSNKFDIDNLESTELFDLIVYETKCRNHYGKFSVTEFLTNKLLLAPFTDPELHKLKLTTKKCDDKYLFYIVFFTRYCPDLLYVTFNDDFEFDYDTISYAERINNLSPFKIKDLKFISGPNLVCNTDTSDEGYDDKDVKNHIMNVFKLHSFEKEIQNYLPEKIYFNAIDSIKKHSDYPLININALIYRLYFLNCIKLVNKIPFDEWVESFYEKNHSHKISSIVGLEEILNDKVSKSHTHDSFSKEQIRFLQKFFGGNLYRNIYFKLEDNAVSREEIFKIKDIEVIDVNGNSVKFNSDDLSVILDDSFPIPFSDLKYNKQENYYELQAFYSNVGPHKLALKYKESYSGDYVIFIKDEDNMFDSNVWSGSSQKGNCEGFNKFNVKSISSSDEWAVIGESSIKVVCDGSSNYQALVTPTQKVNIGDTIEAFVTIYNPESYVIVRLFESDENDFVDIKVPASNNPTTVKINKSAKSNKMQLLLISRDKQIFYADNFIFNINNF